MTTQTVTGAVAKRQPTLSEYVKSYSANFGEVLPSHIKLETWLGIAVSVVRRDAKLAAAAKKDPASLLFALLDAARQGLEPGTEQYYLTPRKDKKTGLKVLGIRGYQGEIELIYRAGAVSSVVVEVVRERDMFIWSPGKLDGQTPKRWEGQQKQPYHDVDWFGERGELKGVYAYAVMKDGATSKVVVLNKDHIALAMSKSEAADTEYSPWQWNPESMWLKTAVHRLQKFVPTSAEYIREQLRAVRDVQAEGPRPTPPRGSTVADMVPAGPEDDDILDADLVDEATDVDTSTAPASETASEVGPSGDPGIWHDHGHPENGQVYAWHPNCALAACTEDGAGKEHYYGHAKESEPECPHCTKETALGRKKR